MNNTMECYAGHDVDEETVVILALSALWHLKGNIPRDLVQ